MLYSQQVIVKRWLPILKEYERTKSKVEPRPFKFVKDLCEAHQISKKELGRYYRKWLEGGQLPESLNGPECKGTLEKEHPFETLCTELGIKHIYTRPYRPQTNGKIEAFFKIIKREFFYPNSFESTEEMTLNLGNYLFEFNHLRKHGGLNYEPPFDKLQKVTELLS